jgi:hypothetical protein
MYNQNWEDFLDAYCRDTHSCWQDSFKNKKEEEKLKIIFTPPKKPSLNFEKLEWAPLYNDDGIYIIFGLGFPSSVSIPIPKEVLEVKIYSIKGELIADISIPSRVVIKEISDLISKGIIQTLPLYQLKPLALKHLVSFWLTKYSNLLPANYEIAEGVKHFSGLKITIPKEMNYENKGR